MPTACRIAHPFGNGASAVGREEVNIVLVVLHKQAFMLVQVRAFV